MEKYIRINNEGDLVLDYLLLDEVSQQNFIETVKNIAAGIELEFDNDPEFSEAEINEGIEITAHVAALECMPDDGHVTTERNTKLLLVEIIEQELRDRYLTSSI